ncbi:MAG: HAD-IA family hydrolase [Acidimicrobiia bacterium]|nr:HAD-IA family hydrolase [Acidimicrobiia bacterium]
MAIGAALFDYGGVILTSPFEAFARYERQHDLPDGFLRRLNATNPDTNAWARLERSEVDVEEFAVLFEEEARAGHGVDAREILLLLAGELRPSMVEAVRRCSAAEDRAAHEQLRDHRDRRVRLRGTRGRARPSTWSWWGGVGVRKPDPRFYEVACEELAIWPHEAVFLDDLGVNLKPARAMGMTTIKVVDPERAIAELEHVVGFGLRAEGVPTSD